MTTAFAYMVRGRVFQAFLAQPAGAVLAGFILLLAVLAVVVLVTGRRLEVNWYRINPMHVMIGALALFLGSWAFKMVQMLVAQAPRVRGG